LNIIPNAIYTMDKAYVDFEALARIDAEYAFFVTRAKCTRPLLLGQKSQNG